MSKSHEKVSQTKTGTDDFDSDVDETSTASKPENKEEDYII